MESNLPKAAQPRGRDRAGSSPRVLALAKVLTPGELLWGGGRGVRLPPPLPGTHWERLDPYGGTRLCLGTHSVGVSPGSRNTILPPLSPQTASLHFYPLSATGQGAAVGCQWRREPSRGDLCATPLDGGRGAWLRAWPVFLAVWPGRVSSPGGTSVFPSDNGPRHPLEAVHHRASADSVQ